MNLFFSFFGLIYEFNISEIPVIVLWGLSCVFNIYAAMRAIPPRLQKKIFAIYKRNSKNALFKYLKQNRGKAF